ncbi:MAG TPA: ABC transporter substrate-binding protein [Stellaceae bacterium]|nr:ABC transporter substrate-binding protein [Stellaceae bacterium]
MIRWLQGGRSSAFIIGIACCMAAAPAPASAETMLTVGKSAPTADALIPVNIGDELGIFKKHGLDLKIIDFGGGSKMAQALAAGSIDIADGAGTEMALVAKGVPMLGVCESAGPAPYLGVGVPWDSPAKKLEDLKGKIIGVSSPGSFSEWLGHQLAQRYGWGPNGVTTVALGNGVATVAAAFKTHQADADIINTAILLTLEETKDGRLLAPVSSYEGNVASGVVYAANALIAKNPDAIRAFDAAWIETTDYMRAHKPETVKITTGITHFDEKVMSREYDLTIAMHTKDCRFDAESLATLKQSFYDLKVLQGEVDMTKLYTEAYVPK